MRTMPTCSPPGPIKRTSGTRMRSLTRVSVLMGPPWVVFLVANDTGRVRGQRWEYHAISKKALRQQGPVPTGHGLSRLRNTEPAQLVCQ